MPDMFIKYADAANVLYHIRLKQANQNYVGHFGTGGQTAGQLGSAIYNGGDAAGKTVESIANGFGNVVAAPFRAAGTLARGIGAGVGAMGRTMAHSWGDLASVPGDLSKGHFGAAIGNIGSSILRGNPVNMAFQGGRAAGTAMYNSATGN